MIRIEDMVEVTLNEKDDFLKIRETLTRIGVASKKEKLLYQSCHILHKQGKYYIVHFKELFALDGKPTDITENDLARRNTIAFILDSVILVLPSPRLVLKLLLGFLVTHFCQVQLVGGSLQVNAILPKFSL